MFGYRMVRTPATSTFLYDVDPVPFERPTVTQAFWWV